MRLDELAAAAAARQVTGAPEAAAIEITGLAYDSRRAHPGTLFFCVPGERADGHEFAAAAVAEGTAALVVERELAELAVPQLVVEDARAAMAPVAAHFHGDPTAELRVAGITGTNGKTTTAFLLAEVLESAAIQCGLLGTVKQVVGAVEEEVERTTPEAIDLQATFRRMLGGGDRACAMEVSSHALALHRVDAVHFELALFTNLTQDHLDFHADMEDYFLSKRRLFEMGPRFALVNVDDPYGRRLAEEFECLTFSAEGAEADFSARDVTFDTSGAGFRVAISPTAAGRSRSPPFVPPPGRSRCGRRCRGTSTSPTRWVPSPPRWRWGSSRGMRPRGWPRRAGCRAGSSRSTRARTSRSSSTMPTLPTRSTTSCARRAA